MKLYKYSPININILSCCLDRVVWFSSPKAFNDPFDCGLVGGNVFDDAMTDAHGVLSLSADVSNPLMWSHYSNSHTGLCLEFEDFTDDELNSEPLKSVFSTSTNPLTKLAIVRNAKEIQYLSTSELDDIATRFPASDQGLLEAYKRVKGTDAESKFIDGLTEAQYMKHEHWSYEKEYRIVGSGGERNAAWPGNLTGVYFGLKAVARQIRPVVSAISKISPATQYFKMEKSTDGYGLTSRTLSFEDTHMKGVIQ